MTPNASALLVTASLIALVLLVGRMDYQDALKQESVSAQYSADIQKYWENNQ